MRAIHWISSLSLLMASAAVHAVPVDRESLLEQMKAMRPVDLVVLDQRDGADAYTLGIFAINSDPADPELRRFKLWQLNPGGPLRLSTREDHLVWWAACHPTLAGKEPESLGEQARELGYSTQLIESQEVLRLPAP